MFKILTFSILLLVISAFSFKDSFGHVPPSRKTSPSEELCIKKCTSSGNSPAYCREKCAGEGIRIG
jgi:hypothetical protein